MHFADFRGSAGDFAPSLVLGGLFGGHPPLLKEKIELFQNLLTAPVNKQLLVYCVKLEVIMLKYNFRTLRHNGNALKLD